MLYQNVYADFLQTLFGGQFFERIQVDTGIFHTVDVLEAGFGNTSVERHLTAFKTDFTAVAGAGLGTLVASAGRLPVTRAVTATQTFVGLDRTFGGFQIR